MPRTIRVFISYSHQDDHYLERDSLLGFLRGLERDDIEFWHDGEIATGAPWDEAIRQRIAASDIALVLVSQPFLDSRYCTEVEVAGFIASNTYVFPLILSPCEWRRHPWLHQRQCLPGGDKTVEEHYRDDGPRNRLFLDVREELRALAERLRERAPNPFHHTLAVRDDAAFIGRAEPLARLQLLLDGGSVALQGPPKLGKSSLLWRLAARWTQGEVIGPLDFHGLEGPEDFWRHLGEKLAVGRADWPTLRAELLRRPLLLLLDELDAAPRQGVTAADLLRLRHVCDHNRRFHLVTASRLPVPRLFPDDGGGSPVFGYLQPMTLEPMPREEAEQLLDHPWAPTAAALRPQERARILDQAGGHPFKLQRGGHHAYHALVEPAHDWYGAWQDDLGQML